MDTPSASAVFPYLRSCEKECETPITGELKGVIPKWLKGNLIRIGSGLLHIGPDHYNHVFDGMALLHRFNFQEGVVTYQSRFLRSNAYQTNMKANRIVVSEFATRGVPDPCKTIFQRFFSLFNLDNLTDNDLVNVILYSNEAYACMETNNIWKIDPETLNSLEKVNLKKFVPIETATAHAHEDVDGTVYNVGISSGLRCYYSVLKFPTKDDKSSTPFDQGSVICKIPACRRFNPSYFHSFGMTENYIILVEQPMYLSIAKMAWAHFVSGTYADALHLDPNSQSIFHVVRRSDGKRLNTTYTAEHFFVFHHINAYEEDDHLIVDLCGYERGEIVKLMYVKALEDMFSQKKADTNPFASKARRYVLPLKIDKNSQNFEKNLVTLPNTKATATQRKDGSIFCTFEILTDSDAWSPELPRINYKKCNGKKYKYFYSMAENKSVETRCLLKINTENKTATFWTENGVIPSEPVFLEDPDNTNEEDAGVILASLLYEDDESKVSLLVLNARNMQELGRVTFKTSSSVPGDFHGVFISKD